MVQKMKEGVSPCSSGHLMAQLCTVHSTCTSPGPLHSCSVWVSLYNCNLLLLTRKISLNYELVGSRLSSRGRMACKLLKFLQKMQRLREKKLVVFGLLDKALFSPTSVSSVWISFKYMWCQNNSWSTTGVLCVSSLKGTFCWWRAVKVNQLAVWSLLGDVLWIRNSKLDTWVRNAQWCCTFLMLFLHFYVVLFIPGCFNGLI